MPDERFTYAPAWEQPAPVLPAARVHPTRWSRWEDCLIWYASVATAFALGLVAGHFLR